MNNIIEQVIERNGGRLRNTNSINTQLYESLQYHKSRAQTAVDFIVKQLKGIKYIEVDIIDSYDFNAFAYGIDHEYFIGINRGTIATLHLIYDRMMADKSVLPFIGNFEMESENLPLIPNITYNYAEIVHDLQEFDQPKDPVRNSYSKYLVKKTIDFLVAHEINHIVHGHVAYLNNTVGFEINELNYVRGTREFNLFSKTIEMDADSTATEMLLTSEMLKVLGRATLPEKFMQNLYIHQPGLILLQYGYIISTIFRIFGDQRLDNDTFENEAYPRPRLRYFIAMKRIATVTACTEVVKEMNFPLDEYGVPAIIEPAFQDIESVFKIITGKNINKKSIEDARGEIGKNQLNKLIINWNKVVKNKLQPHAYIKLFDYDLI